MAYLADLTPFLPFVLILIAAAVVALLMVRTNLTLNDVVEIAVGVGTVLIGVVVVIFFVGHVCLDIHPREQFVGTIATDDYDAVNKLWTGLATAESDVCKMITRADKFIQSSVGQAGRKNPDLVTQAQQKAQGAAGGDLTDCKASWPTDVSDSSAHTLDQTLGEAANRLTRLETTLKGFTGPQFQATYNSTVVCTESFYGGAPTVARLQERLDAVNALIATQQKTLLDPIDQKTKDLQQGKASDCDKKKGANAAMSASVKMPPGGA